MFFFYSVPTFIGEGEFVPGPLPTLAYVGASANDTDGGTFTFNGVGNVGTGSCLAIVGISSRHDATVSQTCGSIKINGVDCNLHTANTAAANFAGVASLEVAGNTTCNVVVRFSGSRNRCAVMLWSLRNYTNAIPLASNSTPSGVGTSDVLDLTMLSNTVSVWAHSHGLTGATGWSSATERVDAIHPTDATGVYSGADKSTASDLTPHTETITTGGNVGRRTAAAAWN